MFEKIQRVYRLVLGVFILLSAPAVWAGTNVSGSIASDTAWSASGSSYIVTGDVTVEKEVTLTISSN